MHSEYIVPLGVSAAVPANDRHFASVAFVAENFVVLFDCGEGTQFRLASAGIRTSRIRAIAITHLHGDHYLGLPGLLSTMSMQRRTEPLTVVAPQALADVISLLPGIGNERRPFQLDIRGLQDGFTSGNVLRWDYPTGRDSGAPAGFSIEAGVLDHSVVAYGYRLRCHDRPGRLDVSAADGLGVTSHEDYRRLKEGGSVIGLTGKIVSSSDVVSPATAGAAFAYVSDTRPCDSGVALARDVDLLYHESTFMHSDLDRAIRTGHSTALEAGEVAAAAGARRLVLGHFSARYKDVSVLVTEAKAAFSRVDAAEELRRYYLDGVDSNP